MLRSIIQAGGESTRIREVFDGPKPLAPVGNYTLLSLHLQPLIKSKLISKYIFTLRHKHEIVQNYINEIKREFDILTHSIVEPKPIGRAGVVRLGIENKIIDTENPHLISYPDDLIPINIKELIDYASDAERKDKSLIMVMAKRYTNPFGIGVGKKVGDLIELRSFIEKPELPFIENHYAATGMLLFLPESMEEFKNAPLDRITHPEHEIVPRLVKKNKVAVFPVERWISVNYSSDYKSILQMGPEKLLEFLKV